MKLTPSLRTLLTLASILAVFTVSTARAAVLDDCRQRAKDPVQISSCLREAQIKADDALNAAIARTRKRIGNNPQALRGFDESQQAWQIQRSRECRRRFGKEVPGSAAGEIRMACEIELARERLAAIDGNRP